MASAYSNPTVEGCAFEDNRAGMGGGGLSMHYDGHLSLRGCTFLDNTTDGSGGAIHLGDSVTAEIRDSVFRRNLTQRAGEETAGGAIAGGYGSVTALVHNCLFDANAATRGNGGAINLNGQPSMTIENCTFGANTAAGRGGAYYGSAGAWVNFQNCIIWGNSPEEIRTDGSLVGVTYSDVRGGWVGEGNINADPLWRHDGPDGTHYLQHFDTGDPQDSPCVDRGTGSAEEHGLSMYTTRIDGIPDLGRVDLGFHHPVELCGLIGKVKVSCRKGTLKMRLTSDLPQGVELTAMLDDSQPLSLVIDRRGKAKAKWRRIEPGPHEACVVECGMCREVGC